MTAKLGSLGAIVATVLGDSADGAVASDIAVWLARLEEWNARMDLTAARTPEELVDLMLADAMVLATRIPPDCSLVDVGTGAGGPGLALALLRRDLRVTLVEPLGKRASFLRTVVGAVGRTDITIERKRGEAIPREHPWDVALSRATLPPAAWLDLAIKLVASGGTIWVLVASEHAPAHEQAVLESDCAYVWPLTGAPRRALAYRRLG